MEKIYGKSIYEGIIIAEPYLKGQNNLEIESFSVSEEDIDKEIERYEHSIKRAKEKLSHLIHDLKGKVAEKDLQILSVHFMMLDDPMFKDEIQISLRKDRLNVEEIIKRTVNKYSEAFKKMKNPLYRQRALDIQDIGERLLEALADNESIYDSLNGKILIAHDILPSELLDIFNKKIDIKGIVMEYVGETSHTAILAKSLEIPTFMGGTDLLKKEWGEFIILDTYSEKPVVITRPSLEVLKNYKTLQLEFEKEKEEIKATINLPSVTLDNVKINLEVNAGQKLDKTILDNINADGIGLLRTEFIYMKGNKFPEEIEQIKIYEKVSDNLGKEKPLIIRTLDIGADKSLPYYKIPSEQNPSLGERGLRFTLHKKEILKTQIRAILRASKDRNIKIMHPMVTNISEIESILALTEEIKKELTEEGISFNDNIKTGIMVEVPSAVLMADKMGEYIDFFSIGSNDLAQYILATDRFSQKENNLYDYYNPAVLKAINLVAEASVKNNTDVAVCGEMAGEVIGIVILLSFGIKTLSMSTAFIPRARNIVRKLNISKLEKIKKSVLNSKNSEEVRHIVREYIKNL
ncbi:phosphoenolpyruvate--protein phosphotransferase [Fusobacterium sp.]|uniref:phosphoenolpyruvate--protein phosphotransferase n=1 Tax=Fusobacterium sp. TaxID=68766 RepID=UPI00262EF570|nr:phosphoenolpyruvate--protein phosphotransferase [Fusobacterium sp.]